MPPGAADPGTRIPIGRVAAWEEVWKTGRPAHSDQQATPPFADLKSEVNMAAPVLVEGRLWGVLGVGWNHLLTVGPEIEGRLAELAELVATAIANAENQAELTASRARVVAAADRTRRRIERDLHDGTQQRLVSIGLDLRAAEAAVPVDYPALKEQLARSAGELGDAVEDLREISRGIHPAILSKGGLEAALKTLARRSALPVDVDIRVNRRYPEPVEVAAYYVVSEALTNATKHAQASAVHVALSGTDGMVEISVRDDGVGGADPKRGTGLIGLCDRVEALGGKVEITSPPGGGTSMRAAIPAKATG
jgi:signal transduction histidine kinase